MAVNFRIRRRTMTDAIRDLVAESKYGSLKIFVKEKGCPLCDALKPLIPPIAKVYDVETADGLAEATFYGIMSVPAIVENGELKAVGQEAIEYLRNKEF